MKHAYASLFCLITASSSAQLTVTDSLGTAALTSLLEGLNITITNLTVNCAGAAFGQFSGASEIPITNGLVLTTGAAEGVAGPVANFASVANNTPGDTDLINLLGGIGVGVTFDACVLEFDCVPLGDTLLFNFAFGSEEYPEFVGSGFNDVFAIWLSGPGFPIATNVAAIPGGTPVSINNVNATTNATYYVDNEIPAGVNCAYDGFTQNLTAFAVVTPGANYHIKVAVADVGDMIFDTGVFLEAFSFRSVFGISSGMQSGRAPTPSITCDGSTITIAGATPTNARLLDLTGRTVLRFRVLDAPTMLTPDLPAGSYVVALENGARRSILLR